MVGVDLGLVGNGILILRFISATSAKLVIKANEHSCNTS